MKSKNEKTILSIIKFTPPLFIITLSVIISFALYINKQEIFKEEKKQIEEEYISNNKEIIKNEVNNIYAYIMFQQQKTEQKLKNNLKERIYEAYDIAMNIYNENKHLEKEVVQKMIKDALRKIRFNNKRGYFFIHSFDHECILLPISPEMEGTSLYNLKEGKGEYLTRNIVKMLKKEKEGFMKWWYQKPLDMKNQYEKLGFNKHFEPYDWFIGTGEYIDDFENDIKKNVLEHIHNLKYPKNGYIFVIDNKGKYLNHMRTDKIGTNSLKSEDTFEVVNKFRNILKKKSSDYLTYVHIGKPGSNFSVKKTSFIKNVENWEWIIGKGFYEDDMNKMLEQKEKILEERLKENLNNLIITSTILTLLLVFISVYISKILEKKFTRYQKEIQTNLEELTKQHNILAQQSKMAAIGEMIANIAHQWRQPLSTISTAATGLKLKREFNELSDQEFNSSLDYINKSTQYLSKTIDDFRNFFSQNQEYTEFYIEEAFRNALNIVSSQFKNKNIEIIQNFSKTKILGIKSELVQVLINLLNNARDELIKIKEDRRLIFIDTFEKNKILFITIKDNAGGINQKNIEHIFEPYFTTKHKSQGTGIGLYMSQEIIVKHLDGSIEIENTKFEFEDKFYDGAKVIIKLNIQKS